MNLSDMKSKLDSFCNEMKTAWTDISKEVADLKATTMKVFEQLDEIVNFDESMDSPDQRSTPTTLPPPADSLEDYEKWMDSLVRIFLAGS